MTRTSSSHSWIHVVLEVNPVCGNMAPQTVPQSVCRGVHLAHLHSQQSRHAEHIQQTAHCQTITMEGASTYVQGTGEQLALRWALYVQH